MSAGGGPLSAESAEQVTEPSGGPWRAALWMLGAVVSFSLMAIAGRELATSLNTFQIMFWRSIVGATVVIVALTLSAKGLAQVRSRRPGLHLTRNIAHFFGQNCWLYAVATIPLAQAFALEFTTPLWVALLAPLILGERFSAVRVGAAAFGFLGVLLVVRPDADGLAFGQMVALAAALGFAANVLATKSLSATETTLSILFWMTVSQAIMAVICDVAVSGSAALPVPSAAAAPWVVAVGLCGLGAHFCMASAFRHAEASVVAPMDFLRLPVIAAAGAALYAEAVDPLVFLGGAVIFLGNYVNIRMASAPSAAR